MNKMVITIDEKMFIDFKVLCAKKKITMSDAIRKIIAWRLKTETGKEYSVEKINKNIPRIPEEVVHSMREQQEKRGRNIAISSAKDKVLIGLFNAGLPYREISKRTNIPKTTVIRRIKNILLKNQDK